MLHSLTIALALPGKQSHMKEAPGSPRGLALQTIEAVAPFTTVADCAAQLLAGMTPGSKGGVVALSGIESSSTAAPGSSRVCLDRALAKPDAGEPDARLAPRPAGSSTVPPDAPLCHFMPSPIEYTVEPGLLTSHVTRLPPGVLPIEATVSCPSTWILRLNWLPIKLSVKRWEAAWLVLGTNNERLVSRGRSSSIVLITVPVTPASHKRQIRSGPLRPQLSELR